MTVEQRFRAMGTDCHIIVVGGGDHLAITARERVHALERLWSRFLPDSEISRMNAGADVPLSWETELLLTRAEQGQEVTNGRFDPWVLADVVAAGYDDFYRTETGPDAPKAGFDPGGIGKGLTADLVAQELLEMGAKGALINIGGDLRVRGTSPDNGGWRIAIEDPRGGPDVCVVGIDDGAVATSSTVKRQWTDGEGQSRHHLVDPSTHANADSPVLSATVIAAQGWQAEILAKPVVLDWAGDGASWHLVEQCGAAAMVVTAGLTATSSRWADFELVAGDGDRPNAHARREVAA